MEMIVAVGLFAITSVFIAQLFAISGKAQKRSGSQQKVQADARVMMNQISDRIRTSKIDYAFYGGSISFPETVLALEEQNGQRVIIRVSSSTFASTVCPDEASTPCLEISEDGGSTYQAMSSKNFIVSGVQFYISPSTDPEPQAGPDEQPRVTMVLGLQGSGVNDFPNPVHVQTTVSSRVYVR